MEAPLAGSSKQGGRGSAGSGGRGFSQPEVQESVGTSRLPTQLTFPGVCSGAPTVRPGVPEPGAEVAPKHAGSVLAPCRGPPGPGLGPPGL